MAEPTPPVRETGAPPVPAVSPQESIQTQRREGLNRRVQEAVQRRVQRSRMGRSLGR